MMSCARRSASVTGSLDPLYLTSNGETYSSRIAFPTLGTRLRGLAPPLLKQTASSGRSSRSHALAATYNTCHLILGDFVGFAFSSSTSITSPVSASM